MPLRIQDSFDVNMSGKSNTSPTILQYDDTLKVFKLTTIPVQEDFIHRSVEDGNLPDDFIDQLENQISVPALSYENVDAGSF